VKRLLLILLTVVVPAFPSLRKVGPQQKYRTICAAIQDAKADDVIEISAGDYVGDVCVIRAANLTLRGIGPGRPHVKAGGKSAQEKAIWVVAPTAGNIVIENIEFSGATVTDHNGAGIRVDPGTGDVTIRNCYFHDNENGVLTGARPGSHILVEGSWFENNGKDSFSHNIYVGVAKLFTFQGNYSTKSLVGHLVKTRAAENRILYNRLTMETGTGSRLIDVSNGGLTYVIGNVMHQGPNSSNHNLIGYQREGPRPTNPDHQLYVINNTMISAASPAGAFIEVDPSVRMQVVAINNVFLGSGTQSTQTSALLRNNFTGDPRLANSAGFDFRPCASSPLLDIAAEPGMHNGFDLNPKFQYRHPALVFPRQIVGKLDIGAYEHDGLTCPGR